MVALVAVGLLTVVIAGPALVSAGNPDKQPDPESAVVTWTAEEGPATGTAAVPAVVVAPTQTNLEFVAFGSSCRFMDTRIVGGALAKNEQRDFPVLDAALPLGLGPCGVPTRAKGIQLSIGTVRGSATAVGNVRVGPGGVAATQAVIQYAKGQAETAITFVALSADTKIRVGSMAASVGVFGDLLGYYQEPVWGQVAADGTLVAGSGVTSIMKSGAYAGDYYIYIDRPVSSFCAPALMLETNVARAFGMVSSSYLYIDVRDYLTTNELDGAFSFVLQC